MNKEEFLKKCSEMYDKSGGDVGKISDGYHTFDELYHHRALLFASIVNVYRTFAWKSKKHSDGSMFDGMFIVGIETPEGSATYHYEMEYWDKFHCKEMDTAPVFDGHTPDDAINRIFNFSDAVTTYTGVYTDLFIDRCYNKDTIGTNPYITKRL